MSWAGRLQKLLISLFVCLSVFYPSITQAAKPDRVEDLLIDARASVASKHTVTIDQTSGTAFQTGETIILTFPAQFSIPSLATSDISFNDGSARTLLTSCSAGINNISMVVTGQVITFTACASFVAESAGNTITIVLGTGSTQITNPSVSSIYVVETAGSYGDSAQGAAVAITTGVNLSLTIPSPTGNVRFTGDAFPNAIITILDGGAVAGTGVANAFSFFDKTITGLVPGVHTFGIYGQSLDGRQTLMISFNINVISGMTITVNGILLPPILTVPNQEKRPKTFVQTGLARHNSTVNTFTAGPTNTNQSAATNANGEWTINVPLVLHLGAHTVSGLVNDGFGNQSVLTNASNFEILLSADLNIDNLVSLTDFSMLMFNYGLSSPPNQAADINDNGGQVDLVDFSVMMFYWTGG